MRKPSGFSWRLSVGSAGPPRPLSLLCRRGAGRSWLLKSSGKRTVRVVMVVVVMVMAMAMAMMMLMVAVAVAVAVIMIMMVVVMNMRPSRRPLAVPQALTVGGAPSVLVQAVPLTRATTGRLQHGRRPTL